MDARFLPGLAGLFLVAVARSAALAPADLSTLEKQLAQIRETHGANKQRDAGPELTPVKQALRAWVEKQLPPSPASSTADGRGYSLGPADLVTLSANLNRTLDAAGLTCGEVESIRPCPDEPLGQDSFRGSVAHVRIGALDDGRYLVVVTGVGVKCGYDESAYVYGQTPDQKWRLLLASEQNRYGDEEYAPQNILSIDISPSMTAWNKPAPLPLVATLGYSPWCSSSWQMLHSRLWRASATTPAPKPLVDRADSLYLGGYSIANSRLTAKDWLVEFQGGSIDGGILIRTHVAHYLVQPGDKLERIAPVALGPQEFVEEWLASDWQQAVRWIEPRANITALKKLHATASRQNLFGEFDGPPTRCRANAALWQVAFAQDSNGDNPEAPPRYFKVRWMPPYRFTLVESAPQPFPRCDEQVTMPDDIGTLFPSEGWRP